MHITFTLHSSKAVTSHYMTYKHPRELKKIHVHFEANSGGKTFINPQTENTLSTCACEAGAVSVSMSKASGGKFGINTIFGPPVIDC